jgi:hypothetical protein
MASEPGPAATEDLIVFVDEVVAWTRPVARAYLPPEEQILLEEARDEIERVQLPKVREQIRGADLEELESAGFSTAQTGFKLASARRAMAAGERRAEGGLFQRWGQTREVLESALESVKEILSSISSLSKWIEAVAELVGVVGSGVKAAAADDGWLRRTFRRVPEEIEMVAKRERPPPARA